MAQIVKTEVFDASEPAGFPPSVMNVEEACAGLWIGEEILPIFGFGFLQ
jgi:hypothetical protein